MRKVWDGLPVPGKTAADHDPPCSIRVLLHTLTESVQINLFDIFVTIERKYPVMGGFFHTEISRGAEIIAPVKLIDAVRVAAGNLNGLIRGTGICQNDLKAVGSKPLQAFLDVRLFIFSDDTYG